MYLYMKIIYLLYILYITSLGQVCRSRTAQLYMFNFVGNCQIVFPNGCNNYIFLSAGYENSSSSTSLSSDSGIACLLNFSHSSGCEVVACYGFNLHISDD